MILSTETLVVEEGARGRGGGLRPQPRSRTPAQGDGAAARRPLATLCAWRQTPTSVTPDIGLAQRYPAARRSRRDAAHVGPPVRRVGLTAMSPAPTGATPPPTWRGFTVMRRPTWTAQLPPTWLARLWPSMVAPAAEPLLPDPAPGASNPRGVHAWGRSHHPAAGRDSSGFLRGSRGRRWRWTTRRARSSGPRARNGGVIGAWHEVFLPVLTGIGERWRATGRGAEAEHLLFECIDGLRETTCNLTRPRNARGRSSWPHRRPEEHRLPLQAAAAALLEVAVRAC